MHLGLFIQHFLALIFPRFHLCYFLISSSVFLLVLSLVFAVLTVKKICDLKEEKLRLWQQLRLEMQKVGRGRGNISEEQGGNI